MVKTPPLKEIDADQASLVQNDWDFIKNQPNEVLYSFLDKFPQNMKHFKEFAGKDLEEIKESEEFSMRSEVIVNALTSVIDLLGKDLQGIKDILNKIGSSHRGISKFAFLEFREAFMEFLRFTVGGSPEGIEAWTDVMDLIFHIIFNNLDGNTV